MIQMTFFLKKKIISESSNDSNARNRNDHDHNIYDHDHFLHHQYDEYHHLHRHCWESLMLLRCCEVLSNWSLNPVNPVNPVNLLGTGTRFTTCVRPALFSGNGWIHRTPLWDLCQRRPLLQKVLIWVQLCTFCGLHYAGYALTLGLLCALPFIDGQQDEIFNRTWDWTWILNAIEWHLLRKRTFVQLVLVNCSSYLYFAILGWIWIERPLSLTWMTHVFHLLSKLKTMSNCTSISGTMLFAIHTSPKSKGGIYVSDADGCVIWKKTSTGQKSLVVGLAHLGTSWHWESLGLLWTSVHWHLVTASNWIWGTANQWRRMTRPHHIPPCPTTWGLLPVNGTQIVVSCCVCLQILGSGATSFQCRVLCPCCRWYLWF